MRRWRRSLYSRPGAKSQAFFFLWYLQARTDSRSARFYERVFYNSHKTQIRSSFLHPSRIFIGDEDVMRWGRSPFAGLSVAHCRRVDFCSCVCLDFQWWYLIILRSGLVYDPDFCQRCDCKGHLQTVSLSFDRLMHVNFSWSGTPCPRLTFRLPKRETPDLCPTGSDEALVCVCRQVTYTRWLSHCISTCLYHWSGQAARPPPPSLCWPQSFPRILSHFSWSYLLTLRLIEDIWAWRRLQRGRRDRGTAWSSAETTTPQFAMSQSGLLRADRRSYISVSDWSHVGRGPTEKYVNESRILLWIIGPVK